MALNPENYKKGFLIDDELMGGVSEDPALPGHYLAFVVKHETGETIGALTYPTLEAALDAINAVRREWKYESAGSCGGGNCGGEGCGEGGSCMVTGQDGCPGVC